MLLGRTLPDGTIEIPAQRLIPHQPRTEFVSKNDEKPLLGVCLFYLFFPIHYCIDLVILGVSASAFEKSLLHLHGFGCDDPTLKNEEFDYYVQLKIGMCRNEGTSPDGHDCIKWKDSSFWKEFDLRTDQDYAEKQASTMWFSQTFAVVGLLCLVITPVIRAVELVISRKFGQIWPIALGNVLSLVLSWVYIIGLICQQTVAQNDGLEHGNQLIDEENWMIYHSCTAVNATQLPAFDRIGIALGFALFMGIIRFFMICCICPICPKS